MHQKEAIRMSSDWSEIKITDMSDSVVKKIGRDWMLITSGYKNNYNTMTASWGALGYLWERPMMYIFVRPTRYTFEFLEKYPYFTLSFFDSSLKSKVHKVCGKKSGKDTNKAESAGITPIFLESEEIVGFEEATDMIVCRKIYSNRFYPERFLDAEIEKFYPKQDYHQIYIGEIEHYYKK